MKVKTWNCAASVTLLAAVFMPLQLAAQEQEQTHYFVKDLGTLGGTLGVAEGISDRGWVVGTANLAGDQSTHAFLWRNGVKTDLGTLGGLNSDEEWPVNDNRGLIVGSAETFSLDPLNEDFCGFDSASGVPATGLICLGFLWRDGVMNPLPTLGGNNAQATSVNNRGQVAGFAENATQDPRCSPPQVFDVEAVIWGPKAGEIRELPPLPGDIVSWATGINDPEQVVGLSGNCVSPNFNAPGATAPQHGVIWQNGTVTNLGSLGGTGAFPFAINTQGQVVGQSAPVCDCTVHTFLWQKGVISDLGTLPGDVGSSAFGLNDRGEVVGGSCGPDVTLEFGCRAFLWRNGVMADLNGLVRAGSTPLFLVFGNDINSQGEIAAFAFDQSNGEFHAALVIPCDEQHADIEGCAESTTTFTPARVESAKVALPENIREQLRKRLGLGRLIAPVQQQ